MASTNANGPSPVALFYVDNSFARARTDGLGFRIRPEITAVDPDGALVTWGSIVAGRIVVLESEETGTSRAWLEVDGWYLPTMIPKQGGGRSGKEIQVLRLATASQKRNCPQFGMLLCFTFIISYSFVPSVCRFSSRMPIGCLRMLSYDFLVCQDHFFFHVVSSS